VRIAKYLILLLITLVAVDFSLLDQAHAKSAIPAACTKVKQAMVKACSKGPRNCVRQTNALNQCLKKAAFRPIAKTAQPQSAVCTMIYQPVCAMNAKGFLEIFSNSCVASNAAATEVPFNQCETK
jgi:hypothetical protein